MDDLFNKGSIKATQSHLRSASQAFNVLNHSQVDLLVCFGSL